MKENKVELTDEEKKRRNLINYFLEKDKVLELGKRSTNDLNLQNSESDKNTENSWWYDGEIFNQQAHVIMNILSNSSYAVSNKGYRLWFILASKDNPNLISEEILKNKLKDTLKKEEFAKKNEDSINFNNASVIKLTIKKNFNLCNIVNYQFKHDLPADKLNILLDYTKLYFSKPSNFGKAGDYSDFNKPILNNLYNWYLKPLEKENMKKYCKHFEAMIKNMYLLLSIYFQNSTYRYNLICTICKANKILNKLKTDESKSEKLEIENRLLDEITEKILFEISI